MNVMTPKFGMGAAVLRKEDAAFITGNGRYTDDIQPEGTLYGYVLRSPMAKARIKGIDVEAAKAAGRCCANTAGVVARVLRALPGAG